MKISNIDGTLKEIEKALRGPHSEDIQKIKISVVYVGGDAGKVLRIKTTYSLIDYTPDKT